MSDIIEIKSLIEKQGTAWEEFKKTNELLIQAKADGKAVGDLEVKLTKLSDSMDKFGDVKAQLEEFMAKSTAPMLDAGEAKIIASEVKSFNNTIRAEYQSKGKAVPQALDAEGYKHYKSGFFNILRGVTVDSLDPNERKALIAGSDPDGGYLLPDSTQGQIVSKIYEQSTIRQIANVQSISTNKLEGIIDNGEAGAGWVSELGARADTTTPTLGKYEIEAHEMYAMPKISQRLLDDSSVNIEAWLAGKVADKFGRVSGSAYTVGDGVGKARGLFSYATAATGDDTRAWGTFEHVVTGTNGAFNATTKSDPILDLIGAFRNFYLQNAKFLMRREVRTAIRKLKGATSDLYLWEPSLTQGQPDRLMGYPVLVDQYVPALATNSLSLAFGDFKEAFTIVDRVGIRTLRDPYFAKPYVLYYSTIRTGSGAVNFEAIKFLKFSA